jgi:class 3 adenylate cyclase
VPNDGRPTGTVTFLFTDIEGSTKLWERHPGEMAQALARHDEIVRSVVALHGGVIFATGGDGFAIAFARASDGVSAAMGLQRALGLESWPEPLRLSVRAGLHTGEAIERNGDYFGPAVNRAARLMAAAHGDQIVCSETTQGVLRGQLAGEVRVEELGRIRLRGFSVSERIFGIFGPGLRQEFAPLADLDSEVGSRPGPPDLLIGRAQELDQIVELLASRRVVTLTGTGGVGKTTLALAAIDAYTPPTSTASFVGAAGNAPRKTGSLIAYQIDPFASTTIGGIWPRIVPVTIGTSNFIVLSFLKVET